MGSIARTSSGTVRYYGPPAGVKATPGRRRPPDPPRRREIARRDGRRARRAQAVSSGTAARPSPASPPGSAPSARILTGDLEHEVDRLLAVPLAVELDLSGDALELGLVARRRRRPRGREASPRVAASIALSAMRRGVVGPGGDEPGLPAESPAEVPAEGGAPGQAGGQAADRRVVRARRPPGRPAARRPASPGRRSPGGGPSRPARAPVARTAPPARGDPRRRRGPGSWALTGR